MQSTLKPTALYLRPRLQAVLAGLVLLLLALTPALAVDSLGPRAYGNTAIGTTVHSLSFAQIEGDLTLDSLVPQTEAYNLDAWEMAYRYTKHFNWRGQCSFVSLLVPYADVEGTLLPGRNTSSVSGLRDPVLWLGTAFSGAPAMTRDELAQYHQDTIIAGSLAFSLPFGDYDENRQLNLGSNRLVVKPEVAFSRANGRRLLEIYANAQFPMSNTDAYGGVRLKQEPVWGAEAHFSRTLSEDGSFASVDVYYTNGGEVSINGVDQNNSQNDLTAGVTVVWQVNERDNLRLSYHRDVSTSDLQPKTEELMVRYNWVSF